MFQRISLRYRLLIIPSIAILGFVAIAVLQALFGQEVTRLGNSIRGFVFGIRVQASLIDLSRAFQDAANEENLERLEATEELHDQIIAYMESAKSYDTFDLTEVEQMEATFSQYYSLASDTTRAMIQASIDGDILSEQMLTGIRGMRDLQAQVETQIRELSKQQEEGNLEEDFVNLTEQLEQLQQQQNSAQTLIYFISGAAGIILALMSWLIFQSVNQPISQAVTVADSLSQGNMNTAVKVESDDEIGRLLQSMQAMLGYLREMSDVASAMATGDLRGQIDPRSEDDLFSRAFRDTLENLREMIGRVKEAADAVAGSANEIAGSSSQITSGAESQSASADETLSI